jgi:hypothetical protein
MPYDKPTDRRQMCNTLRERFDRRPGVPFGRAVAITVPWSGVLGLAPS